jgi:cation diffusion facilitator CzcD-associated flavoprotein CzcO
MDAFDGAIVHAAAWDHDLDLTGKRVVLVGAACSGVQVATAIADKVAELTIVMRQPEYMLPNPQAGISIDPLEIYAMENIPFVAQWKRLQTLSGGGAGTLVDQTGLVMIEHEYRQNTGGISVLNEYLRDICRDYVRSSFPDDPQMVDLLTPDYPFFAKRPILDCGYYDTLKKPHVTLIKGGLESFDAGGLILSDGRRLEADVVLFATGYNTYWGTHFNIKGRGGRTIREIFDPTPFSYWGMMVPGLPNFMMSAGPHSHLTANHAMLGEQQIHYLIELLQTMIDEDLASVDVTAEAGRAFLDDVYQRLENTTWANNGTAHGYYRHSSGKVVMGMPRHNSEVWHALRQPRMTDYHVTRHPAAERAPKRLEQTLNI